MRELIFLKAFMFCVFSFFFGELILLLSSGLAKEGIILAVTIFSLMLFVLEFFLTFYRKVFSIFFFVFSIVLGGGYFIVAVFAHGEGGYSNSASWYLTQFYVMDSAKSIKLFRKKRDRCPYDLSELDGYPLKFVDPFNPKDILLKYFVVKDECFIYSIGLDRVDNKGVIVVGNDGLKRKTIGHTLKK